MPGRQVELDEFCGPLSQQDRHQVQEALASGKGMARYGTVTVSYGTRDAFFAGLPPAALDGHELDTFVAPTPSPVSMRSPLLDAVGGPPQIHRPRVNPSMTEYPEVQVEMRTSPHPRGNNKSGYIDAQRFAPAGREPEQPRLELLSEGAQWWAKRLG